MDFQRNRTGRRPQRVEKKDEFDSKLLDLSRVSRMTAGGRRFKFRGLVVVGNKMGKVGIGLAKGKDVAQAVEKATRFAKRNLIQVPIQGDTIPHQTSAKFKAGEILLKPQAKGRGLVAGGTVRIICSLAGIKDISSKVLGRTTNKLSNAVATIEALKKLKIKGGAKIQKAEPARNASHSDAGGPARNASHSDEGGSVRNDANGAASGPVQEKK